MIEREQARQRLAVLAHQQDLGILPERLQQLREHRLGKDRGAEPVHIFGIETVMDVEQAPVATRLHIKVIAQPLAHLGAMLARHGEQLRFVIGLQRLGKVEISPGLQRPAGFRKAAAPQLRRGAALTLRHLPALAGERLDHRAVIGEDAAIDGESARYQRAAEQVRGDEGERQHADDPAAPARDEHHRPLAASTRDRADPGRAMKRGRLLVSADPVIDLTRLRRVGKIDFLDRQRVGQHGAPSFCPASSASMRPQRKSPIRRLNLGAMTPRLV